MKSLYYRFPIDYNEFLKIYNSYPKRCAEGDAWLPHIFYKDAKSDYKNDVYLVFKYKNGEYIIDGYCPFHQIHNILSIIKELPEMSEKYSKELLMLDIERLHKN